MKALPSIAFGGFSGSAKGVTARQVGGRPVLSVRGYPTGPASSAQVVRRASLSRIAKAWKTLTEVLNRAWFKCGSKKAKKSRNRPNYPGKVFNIY